MNYTENEIKEIAIQVLEKIDWVYDPNEGLRLHFTSKEEQFEKLNKVFNSGYLPKEITLEEAKLKVKSYWAVIFDDIPEAEMYNNSIILEINDEDGEPYYLRHRQAGFMISKDEQGGYKAENEWKR